MIAAELFALDRPGTVNPRVAGSGGILGGVIVSVLFLSVLEEEASTDDEPDGPLMPEAVFATEGNLRCGRGAGVAPFPLETELGVAPTELSILVKSGVDRAFCRLEPLFSWGTG